ncbi:MAG: hypothetical protein HY923_04570 [Elusimicrobia bacterium]|nr:hypothetical protein [Elusimicrobiota bacterium]
MRYPSKLNLSRSARAALIGGSIGLLYGTAFVVNKAMQDIRSSSMEEQVRSKYTDMNGGDYICKSAYFESECLARVSKSRQCVESIQNLIGKPLKYPRVVEGLAVPSLAGLEQSVLSAKFCEITPPVSLFSWFANESAETILAPLLAFLLGGMIVGVPCLLILWILDYPHLGWRRLIVVSAPVIGVIGGLHHHSQRESFLESIWFGLTITVMSAIVLVVGREAFLWVRDGFHSEAKNG